MPPDPVLLDCTLLSNFGLVNRPDLVLALWGQACATTAAVLKEYEAGVSGRGLPAGLWREVTILSLEPAEEALAATLLPRLGAGERTCIAIAVHRHGLFASDAADARRVAKARGVAVTGTLGVLTLNIRLSRLSLEDGNRLLAEMIALGYRSPVASLNG